MHSGWRRSIAAGSPTSPPSPLCSKRAWSASPPPANTTPAAGSSPCAYGHAVKKSLAFAYAKPELAAIGIALEIAILGQRRKARGIAEPAYDPQKKRLRRSEEHTSELQTLMRISYALSCL